MGTDLGRVRQLLHDRRIVGLRRGEPPVLRVPERFLVPTPEGGWQVLATLQGTFVLLADAGYSDEEAVRWLLTPDGSLPGSGPSPEGPAPVDSLAAGHKTEVRRRAQALAF